MKETETECVLQDIEVVKLFLHIPRILNKQLRWEWRTNIR